MSHLSQHGRSRRRFLKHASFALAAPTVIPASAIGADSQVAPSNRITVGMIGVGRQVCAYNLRRFVNLPDVQVVALSDADRWRLAVTTDRVSYFYGTRGTRGTKGTCGPLGKVDRYVDFRKLLDRPEIDAVMISTPDHWHVPMAVMAANAGKDVSLEKPIARSVAESRLLADVMKKTNRVFRMDSEFRSKATLHKACALVRDGRIGKLKEIIIGFPRLAPEAPERTEPEPIPKDLEYDLWLGPAAEKPYCLDRVHPREDYGRPGWIRNSDYSDGMICNWGAHWIDVAHCAADLENTCPVEVECISSEFGIGMWGNLHNFEVRSRYANGMTMTLKTDSPYIKLIGEEGTIFATSSQIKSDPPSIVKKTYPPRHGPRPSRHRRARLHRLRQKPRQNARRRRKGPPRQFHLSPRRHLHEDGQGRTAQIRSRQRAVHRQRRGKQDAGTSRGPGGMVVSEDSGRRLKPEWSNPAGLLKGHLLMRNGLATTAVHNGRRRTLAHRLVGLFFVAILPVCAGRVIAAELVLAESGKSDYTIVLPEKPTPVEQTAARELREYVKKATDATIPIVKESDARAAGKKIVVGDGAITKTLLPGFDAEKLGPDSIRIKTVGDDLVLVGHPRRGTLYAVFTFLEDIVGVNWWTFDEEDVPHRPTLVVLTLDIAYTPRLSDRATRYLQISDGCFVKGHPLVTPEEQRKMGLFAARLKLNGHDNYCLTEAYGGRDKLVGWVHTFYEINGLLPPREYFKQHPEWYSLIKGRRTHRGGQLCLTNEAMRDEMVRVVLARLRKNPDATMISVSQNDNAGGYCRCEKCRALDEKEGSPSGSLIHFINAIAEEVEKEFPDVLVETLAYRYSEVPPKHVKPRDNVIIRLCPIGSCHSTTFREGRRNAEFRKNIEAWGKVAKQLYIWDYIANFKAYFLPHPNDHVLADNIRYVIEHGAIGVFAQGDSGCRVGDFVRYRAWLTAHLLWNPDADERKLARKFMNGYYGPAGPYLLEYPRPSLRRGQTGGCQSGMLSHHDRRLAAPGYAERSNETILQGGRRGRRRSRVKPPGPSRTSDAGPRVAATLRYAQSRSGTDR